MDTECESIISCSHFRMITHPPRHRQHLQQEEQQREQRQKLYSPRLPFLLPSRRVPSYAGIDDACAELLDNLDPDLRVPLDVQSDVPFAPRLTEVKVHLFLRAMLKCAPLIGRSYVVKNVLATRGAEAKMQRLAGLWFNRIILLGMFCDFAL